jgi:hypothetical protein
MIVLDTNVVSEMMRPAREVVAWFDACDSASLFTTASPKRRFSTGSNSYRTERGATLLSRQRGPSLKRIWQGVFCRSMPMPLSSIR